jgi:hypothetical protein
MYKYRTMYTEFIHAIYKRNNFSPQPFLSVFQSYFPFSTFNMISELSESQTMENQNSASNSALNEISDSLVLHNRDSPSSILVSQPLIGENYNSWNRSMMMALSAKNKICLIDGSMSKPSNSSPEFKPWMRCNDMVLSWIINSVSKEITASIIYTDNAEAMWKDLKERFSQGNGSRIFQLQKSIAAITQGSHSVSSYYTLLKSF